MVHAHRPRRRSPRRLDLAAQGAGQGGEPLDVLLDRQPPDRQRQLLRRQRRSVVGETVRQAGHEGVRVVRDLGDLVAGGGQGVEQAQEAGRGVEGHRVADAAALGGVGGEDDAHPLVGVVEAAEAGQARGDPGDALDPVGHRPVGGQGHAQLVAVVDDLLERERGTDDAPVELGDGHAEGHVEGGQAAARSGPRGGVGGRGHRLQDGDVEHVEGAGPRLVGGGDRPAGSPRGGDDHVGPPQEVDGGGVVAQGVGVDGAGVGAPPLDGVAQLLDREGVPGQDVGPVGDDRDRGPVGVARGAGGRSGRSSGCRPAASKPKPSRRTVSATNRRRLARLAGPPRAR